MEEGTGVAKVTSVTKHPVVEVAEGVTVGGYTVHAKMHVPALKYSSGLFLVKILEPAALQYLQDERGSLMTGGVFEFGAVGGVSVGKKLTISILPAAL